MIAQYRLRPSFGNDTSPRYSPHRHDPAKGLRIGGLALVVAMAAYAGTAQSKVATSISPEASFSQELLKAEYVVDSSTIDLDFSLWQPVPENERDTVKKSKVEITRSELIRKGPATKSDFKYEFWTTGLGIEPVRLQSNVRYSQAGTERQAIARSSASII